MTDTELSEPGPLWQSGVATTYARRHARAALALTVASLLVLVLEGPVAVLGGWTPPFVARATIALAVMGFGARLFQIAKRVHSTPCLMIYPWGFEVFRTRGDWVSVPWTAVERIGDVEPVGDRLNGYSSFLVDIGGMPSLRVGAAHTPGGLEQARQVLIRFWTLPEGSN